MKVSELIVELEKLNPDAEVFLRTGYGAEDVFSAVDTEMLNNSSDIEQSLDTLFYYTGRNTYPSEAVFIKTSM